MNNSQLIEQVLTLDVSERAGVALQILESISVEDSVDDHELYQEADKRDKEMDLNSANTLTEDEFLNTFSDRVKRLG